MVKAALADAKANRLILVNLELLRAALTEIAASAWPGFFVGAVLLSPTPATKSRIDQNLGRQSPLRVQALGQIPASHFIRLPARREKFFACAPIVQAGRRPVSSERMTFERSYPLERPIWPFSLNCPLVAVSQDDVENRCRGQRRHSRTFDVVVAHSGTHTKTMLRAASVWRPMAPRALSLDRICGCQAELSQRYESSCGRIHRAKRETQELHRAAATPHRYSSRALENRNQSKL
jgi:hypothetical protein